MRYERVSDVVRLAIRLQGNRGGMTVADISIRTVPATTGVTIRRSRESRADNRNWNSEDITTRLASVAGPPSTSAVMQTPIKAPDVPITST